ncbi:hypothetical protein JW948_02705 [bacterium]|nr:hypothetical protein [bacterium]
MPFDTFEGSPNVPLVIKTKIENNNIEFNIPGKTGYYGIFKGQFDKNGITGKFLFGQSNYDGKEIFHLQRTDSYWK